MSFTSNLPLISVVLPVYNAEAYLERAIDSILAQTFEDFECICVDDGSSDRSLAMLRRYARLDPRLRVISRPNTGLIGALNDGLAEARGRLIARMDADDVSLPERFGRQVAYMDAHPECVALGTQYTAIDRCDHPLFQSHSPIDHKGIDAALMRGPGQAMAHGSIMVRHKTLKQLGGYRDPFEMAEDYDLYLRLAEVGHMANLPDVLYQYRLHLKSVTQTRHETLVQSAVAALREAEARRGVRLDWDVIHRRYAELRRPTPITTMRNWSLYATKNGHRKVASRYALAALLRAPMERMSWRVMYWAMSG